MSQTEKPLILVVDDDESTRMLLEFVLRRSYQVVGKADGMAALAWLSSGQCPDAILLDMDMPHLNGFGLMHQLRSSGWYADIPVVMLSGHESFWVREACLRAGADAYLLKPFNPDQLHAAMTQAIGAVPQSS